MALYDVSLLQLAIFARKFIIFHLNSWLFYGDCIALPFITMTTVSIGSSDTQRI